MKQTEEICKAFKNAASILKFTRKDLQTEENYGKEVKHYSAVKNERKDLITKKY